MKDYPHVPAAFINAIAEEGTKAEAVEYLQKLWNENCALRCQAEAAPLRPDSALTRLAAELHRAKWQFDLSEDYQPAKATARALIAKAFNELHRIGDMALKFRDEAKDTPAGQRQDGAEPVAWHCPACEAAVVIDDSPHSPPKSDEPQDIRWAVNVLLEKIAGKFEAWDTVDLWRSDAAATVRGFKHDLSDTADAYPTFSSTEREAT